MIKSVSDYALNKAPIVRANNRSCKYKTLPRNKFRGITKDVLQRQASMCIASMTVSENNKGLLCYIIV